MTMTTDPPPLLDAPAGLKGVVAAETSIGDVRGTEGFFHYRQYSAVDLAEHRPFEDVWALLVDGALPPTHDARRRFAAEAAAVRPIPADVVPLLEGVAASASPSSLGRLRTVLSAIVCDAFGPVDTSQNTLSEASSCVVMPLAALSHGNVSEP